MQAKKVSRNRTLAETTLVKRIEEFITRYVTLTDEAHSLPLALWTINTHLYDSFSVVPYLCITAATKRSGKTLLSEVVLFMCREPKRSGSTTVAAMFRIIGQGHPTLFLDESEMLSSEGQSSVSAFLNSGYRKGQTIDRVVKGEVVQFPSYCPKAFIQIGDVRNTLQDRCIVVRMRRAHSKERYNYDSALPAGLVIAAEIAAAAESVREKIFGAYARFKGCAFLDDREREIWTPLFVIAGLFCPDRVKDLEQTAMDMATDKTQDKQVYKQLQDAEAAAQDDEYATRLVRDLLTVFNGDHPNLSSEAACERLRALPVTPWKKYKGEGITPYLLASMLSRFGLAPVNIRTARGRKATNEVRKGYKRAQVANALKRTA